MKRMMFNNDNLIMNFLIRRCGSVISISKALPASPSLSEVESAFETLVYSEFFMMDTN